LCNPEILDFANFTKLLKTTGLPEKFKLPEKRLFELTEARNKGFLLPSQPLFINGA